MRNKRAKEIRRDLKKNGIDLNSNVGKEFYRKTKRLYKEGKM